MLLQLECNRLRFYLQRFHISSDSISLAILSLQRFHLSSDSISLAIPYLWRFYLWRSYHSSDSVSLVIPFLMIQVQSQVENRSANYRGTARDRFEALEFAREGEFDREGTRTSKVPELPK